MPLSGDNNNNTNETPLVLDPLQLACMVSSLCNNSTLGIAEDKDKEKEKPKEGEGDKDNVKVNIINNESENNNAASTTTTTTTTTTTSPKQKKINKKYKKDSSPQWEASGDPTEVALLVMAQKVGLGKNFWMMGEKNEKNNNCMKMKFLFETPFDR